MRELYFVSNQTEERVVVDATFRVAAKVPELWHPDTGLIERAPLCGPLLHGSRHVPVTLEPSGSVFVVFRNADDGTFPLET